MASVMGGKDQRAPRTRKRRVTLWVGGYPGPFPLHVDVDVPPKPKLTPKVLKEIAEAEAREILERQA